MKKVLLASAALLALGTAAQASDPVKLSIGGYAIENVGYAHNNTGLQLNDVDVQDDVNVNFIGSAKLDNGITVGVEVDTFGSQRQDTRAVNSDCGKKGITGTGADCGGNGNVKRSFVTVGTAYGTAIVGEREDVGYIVHNSAPDVGSIGLQDGTWFQWVVSPKYHRAYTATNASRYDDRTQKFTYVSPSLYGLAAAFTYAPSISSSLAGHTSVPTASDNAVWAPAGYVNGANFGGDLYVYGLAYANTFGDVSVKADAGFGQANIANLRVYQGGLNVGYAGFTLGGSIFNRHVSDDATVNGFGGSVAQGLAYAGQSWDLGLSYKIGAYAVSLGYFHDTTKDGLEAVNGATNAYGGAADSTQVWSLGGAYTAGPGVTFRSGLEYISYKDGNGLGDPTHKNQGVAFVNGVKIDF